METTTTSLNLAVRGLGNHQPCLKAVMDLLGEAIPRRLQGRVVRHGHHSAKRNGYFPIRAGLAGLFDKVRTDLKHNWRLKRCYSLLKQIFKMRKLPQDINA